ncbi:MAG: carbon monoxide dehydrogenase subunit G [Woeseiaceae bacterium]|nr:carbon monoxide dehydrogenase subunit G [Woeseiaceae bacterium]
MTGEYRIDASRDAVWDALNDPQMLKICIPGCEALEQVGDNAYTARVKAAVGPVRATFQSKLTIEDPVPPESYTLRGDAKAGAAGFGRGAAKVSLADVEEGTLLSYSADFKVGGKLAQVGSRLVTGATRKTAEQFFGNLSRELAPAAAEPEPPKPAPASRQQRAWVLAAIAAIMSLIAWILLR